MTGPSGRSESPQNQSQTPLKSYEIAFVVGPPASGKTDLCDAIRSRWPASDFDFISLAALLSEIAATGRAHEMEVVRKYLKSDGAIPVATMTRIIIERLFPGGEIPGTFTTVQGKGRGQCKSQKETPPLPKVLISGFPQTIEQWRDFKNTCKKLRLWKPTCGAFAIELDCTTVPARLRMPESKRKHLVQRYEEWEKKKKENHMTEQMEQPVQGVEMIESTINIGDVEKVVNIVIGRLERNEKWKAFPKDDLAVDNSEPSGKDVVSQDKYGVENVGGAGGLESGAHDTYQDVSRDAAWNTSQNNADQHNSGAGEQDPSHDNTGTGNWNADLYGLAERGWADDGR